MGYTTEFSGCLEVVPPLDSVAAQAFNTFCETRHGGAIEPHFGMPSLWCDWCISEDGKFILWNGSEKAYKMFEWLNDVLTPTFLIGRELKGEIIAQGENMSDRWIIIADKNGVRREKLK